MSSKEYKEITFTSYDIDTLSKLVHTCTNTDSSDADSSIFKEDVISTFAKINEFVLETVQKKSDPEFNKLSVPMSELITPVQNDSNLLTHFELNSELMKVAYLKDYRNVDTIKEAVRMMIILNRVIFHDKELVTTNTSDTDKYKEPHKLVTSKEVQTEFNDLIRNFLKRNIMMLKSSIDSIPVDFLHEQYKESNDEDILFVEYNNIKMEEAEESNAFEILSKLFGIIFERTNQIKENRLEMSFSNLFDFSKIFQQDPDDISIFTDDSQEIDKDTLSDIHRFRKKIKVKKLRDIFGKALVDVKRKGKINLGDKNLDVFLNLFLKEDPKKIILLIDNFLTLARPLGNSIF